MLAQPYTQACAATRHLTTHTAAPHPLPASHRRTRGALRNARDLVGSSDCRLGDRPGRFKRR
jgi:hypothetical protein